MHILGTMHRICTPRFGMHCFISSAFALCCISFCYKGHRKSWTLSTIQVMEQGMKTIYIFFLILVFCSYAKMFLSYDFNWSILQKIAFKFHFAMRGVFPSRYFLLATTIADVCNSCIGKHVAISIARACNIHCNGLQWSVSSVMSMQVSFQCYGFCLL